MVQLMVLISLVASAAALGYPRERPSAATPQSGVANTEAPPQSSTGTTSSDPPAVSYPSPVAAPGLVGAGLYPGQSSDYLSRYYGLTAAPVVLPDGHIVDTAAVTAARAAHLAALEKAKALLYAPRDDGFYDPYKFGDYTYNYNKLLANALSGQLGAVNPNLIPAYLQNLGSRPYYGPMDMSLGIPKGYVAEAKAAEMTKEAQMKALEKARADAFLNANIFPYASFYPNYFQNVPNGTNFSPLATLLGFPYSGLQGPLNRPYFGPLATPTLLSSGYLADTPEVAAASAAHLSALLRAKALWDAKGAGDILRYGSYGQHLYNNHLQNYKNRPFFNPSGVPKDLSIVLQGLLKTPYSGPLATPTVLPSGYLADTPATAAARAAHLSALARARAEAALWTAHHLYKRSN